MELYSGHINRLIEELAALPGIGSKSAQRLAFHLINMPQDRVNRLANTITEAKANVKYCKEFSFLIITCITIVYRKQRGDYHEKRCKK